MRKFLALTMATAMALSMAACGGNSAASTASSAATSTAASTATATDAATDEPITLNWAVWDKDTTAYWQAMADGYMAARPNVTMELTDLGANDYATQLATQLSGGHGDLDIVTMKDVSSYSNLISLGMLEPLNGKITTDTEKFGGTIEQLTSDDGNFYEVPFRSDFWVVYYNKDLFDAAGVAYPTNDMTFKEYDELARKMTSGEGDNKVYGCHYHTWRSAATLFGVLDGKNSIVGGNYEFLKPYYEAVLADQKDGVCMDYSELKTSGLHYSAAFENGQAAMLNMGSWFLSTLQTYNAEAASNGVEPINFGIVKYPHPDGVAEGTTLGTIAGLSVNANSAHKEQAIDFLNWCVSEEGTNAIAATGTFPAARNDKTMDIIAATDGFPDDENSKAALQASAVYLELPLSNKASEIDTILTTEYDAIMTGAETVDEGIANMNEQVQATLNG